MKKRTKTLPSWTWSEIKLAVQEVYDAYHHVDSWGLEVIYRKSMIQHLKEKLK